MALMYRARVDLDAERTATELEEAFSAWLAHKRLPAALPVSGARRLRGGQEVYRASHAADGIEALRLSLLEDNRAGRWRTTCTAVREGGAPWQVVIDLDRTGSGPPPAPLAPVLVRRLLGPASASPAGTPLRDHAVPVLAGDVTTLLDAIRWAERDVPVVVAYDDGAHVDGLAEAVAGVALVIRLTGDAPAAFNEAAGAGYRIRRGAWRTYLPGACGVGDDSRRHRALSSERITADGQAAVRLVAGSFRSGAVATPLPELYRARVADVPGFRSAERLARREAAAADGADERLAAARVEEELIELVEGLERELADERSARRDGERDRDDAVLDAAVQTEDLSRLRSKVQHLERELLAADVRPWELPEAAHPEAPGSFAELLEVAGGQLSLLVFGPGVVACLDLEDSARAASWTVKVWDALLTLQSFAEGRTSSGFEGNVEQWCRDCPPGARTISANAVSMTEHETIQNNRAMREARTFDVPTDVDVSGRVPMWSHVKIDIRDPAPRLHFLDDTRGSGRVYIGYIGRHLLSPKTT